ncbi:MAG: hypothetical protein SOZ40_05760 [Ezakiella sp.]|nr:hypothetical protein [Ezakiella sp.]
MLNIKEIYDKLSTIDALTYEKGEVDMAKMLYYEYLKLDYFKEHPENVRLIATDEDEFVRFNQLAIVEKGESKDAVIVINTMDEPQVGRKFSNVDAKVLKATLASSIAICDELSKTINDGIVIFINVCDRYGEQKGIESVVKYLSKLKEDGINFKAAITTHGFLTKGEEAIFFGAQAIIKPAIFIAGKTVRTTLYHEGLDPAYMLSTFTRDLTLNSVLMDNYQNEVSEPIYVNRSLVPGGTEVQSSSWGYTSFLTSSVKKELGDYIELLKEIVLNSYKKAIDELNIKYSNYCLKRNIEFTALDVTPKVYTWDEYLNELVTVRGNSIISAMNNEIEEKIKRQPDLPLEEHRLRLVKSMYDKYKLADEPIIIIYYEDAPVQRVDITGNNELERDLMLAFTSAINKIKPTISRRFFFPDLSYHSYLNASDDLRDIKHSLKFIPCVQEHEIEKINFAEELSIPTVNVGGITKAIDGKFVFDEEYHFNTLPSILIEGIGRLF